MRFGSKFKWLLLGLIVVVAAALRFYRLADYPPGLSFDEAFHQVAAMSVLDGHFALYFTENMGMDPMFAYLIALLFKVFGVTVIGSRVVSATAGTLAVPAMWWLASELFADWDERSRVAISASSSFVLATMQWSITTTRTGIQPSLTPVLLVLTMAFLWRGLRNVKDARQSRHWGWFVGAGVFLGAGPYAYSASRVVPSLIVGVAVWLFLFERETFRKRWRGLLLCAGVSILVFAPLGIYFGRHPEWLVFRAGQVTFYTLGDGSSSPGRVLWENTVKTLAAFNFRGDVELIRNLPGRPALDVYQSALFFLGIGVCSWNIYRSAHGVIWKQRSGFAAEKPNSSTGKAHATLLLWLVVMLLPTILTEYAPHFIRGVGVPPAVALLVGLGAATAWRSVSRAGTIARWIARLVLCVGLIASAIAHGHAYFVRWGSQPDLYRAYDVGLLAASQEVYARVPQADVYLSPIQMGHPIVRFITWNRHGAKSYDGRYCLVLAPATERPADYVIVPYLDDRSLDRLPQFYPDGEIVAGGGYRDGVPYYQVYRVPAGSEPRLSPQQPVDVAWADQIGLFGFDVDRRSYKPGESILLTLYWRSLAPVEEAFTTFTHLLGPTNPQTDSPVWAGADHEPGLASYPTSAWRQGEVIVDEFLLPIPADAPPGEYDIEVGFYQLQTMQRLPVSNADVKAGTDYVVLGKIIVSKN